MRVLVLAPLVLTSAAGPAMAGQQYVWTTTGGVGLSERNGNWTPQTKRTTPNRWSFPRLMRWPPNGKWRRAMTNFTSAKPAQRLSLAMPWPAQRGNYGQGACVRSLFAKEDICIPRRGRIEKT
jgi:hypothetical protein